LGQVVEGAVGAQQQLVAVPQDPGALVAGGRRAQPQPGAAELEQVGPRAAAPAEQEPRAPGPGRGRLALGAQAGPGTVDVAAAGQAVPEQVVHGGQEVGRLGRAGGQRLPAGVPDAGQGAGQQVGVVAVPGDVRDDDPERAVAGVQAGEPVAAEPVVADAL